MEGGCDWIETDVRITADGVPVLLHDATTDRTTDGNGALSDLTSAQLLRLDAGVRFGSRFRGERIPLLEDALDWSRGRCGMNLEIKEEARTEDLIRKLALQFRPRGSLDKILFSSFRPRVLKQLRSALPPARLAWLASRSTRGLTALNRAVGLAALHPKERLVTPRLLKRCRRMGLAVHTWVVNRRDRLEELEKAGVDGVMTDDPRIFQV